MKHLSKVDNTIYDISESCTFENGELKRDDITLIWLHNGSVQWYWGGYDFDTVEYYIRKSKGE